VTELELVANVAHGAAKEATTGINLGVVQTVLVHQRLHLEQGAHHLGGGGHSVPVDDHHAATTAHGELVGTSLHRQHESGQGLALDLRLVDLVLGKVVAQQAAGLQVHVVQALPGHIPVGTLAQAGVGIGQWFNLVGHLYGMGKRNFDYHTYYNASNSL